MSARGCGRMRRRARIGCSVTCMAVVAQRSADSGVAVLALPCRLVLGRFGRGGAPEGDCEAEGPQDGKGCREGAVLSYHGGEHHGGAGEADVGHRHEPGRRESLLTAAQQGSGVQGPQRQLRQGRGDRRRPRGPGRKGRDCHAAPRRRSRPDRRQRHQMRHRCAELRAIRPKAHLSLQAVTKAAPSAHIYLVSVWAFVQSYADVAKSVPAARDSYTGDGPCDLFDSSGAVRHQGVVYQQGIIDQYDKQLKASAAQYRPANTTAALASLCACGRRPSHVRSVGLKRILSPCRCRSRTMIWCRSARISTSLARSLIGRRRSSASAFVTPR
jgi:hypothetical protein